jgi:PAS domain S-box-containing protein
MLEIELFAFLEKTADAAFAVTAEGEICSWNRAAERLFGYASTDVLGRTCSEVLDGRDALGTQACTGKCSVHQCAADKPGVPDFDLEVNTRSGDRLWVNVSTLVFEEQHRRRRLVVHLARDISKRKKREEVVSTMSAIAKEMVAASNHHVDRMAPTAPLSEQEQRILHLFSKAKNSSEIGRQLGITLPTLRNHLHSINEKLRTHNRLDAVMHAMQRGLI